MIREQSNINAKNKPEPYQINVTHLGKSVEVLNIDEKYYSFKLLHLNRSGRIVAYWLIGLFIVVIGAFFLPWQQNIRATGFVTALKPSERPQTLNSTIGGMIQEWYVQEGEFVHKGDYICKIQELKDKYFDPNTVDRIGEQVLAKAEGINNLAEKAKALEEQIQALNEGLKFSIQKAQNKVLQSRLKVKIDSADYAAARLDLEIEQQRLKRQIELFEKGLVSLTKLESHKLKVQESQAKLTEKLNKFEASKNELENVIIELNSIDADYQSKIAKAASDKNETVYKLNDTKASLAKLKNEKTNIEIRNSYYIVRAPQDGYIVKSMKTGIGEVVKEGESILTIMPMNHTPAVELYVAPNDVPLLSPGRKVRLEFDGWPALQVSGWPSVSVGTFGGEIKVIDYVNSKDGKYRVLVVQDQELIAKKSANAWPRQLRVGSGVYGWAMLDEVPVWFEIWRQLNGFPPSLRQSPDDEESKDAKSDLKMKLKVKK